jgi:signal transduction histidine kinase
MALVVVPLSIGTVILIALYQLTTWEEKVTLAERSERTFVEDMSFTLARWSQLTGLLLLKANGYKAPRQAVDADQEILFLKNTYAHARKLRAANQNQRSALDKLQKVLDSETTMLTKISQQEVTAQEGFALFKLKEFSKILPVIVQNRIKVLDFLNQEWEQLRSLRNKEDEQRNRIKVAVYVFGFLDIVLSVTLVIYFSRSMTNRLDLLINSAKRLPQNNQPVKLPGDDEIAYLGSKLEQTANRIGQAAEYRRSIVDMIAHDMRAPLMAAQVSTELVVDECEAFCEEAQLSLDAARQKLSKVIAYVQELLKTQKDVAIEAAQTPEQPDKQYLYRIDRKSVQKRRLSGARIFHKGLILVLAPLLVQSIILTAVTRQLWIAEKHAGKERMLSDGQLFSAVIALHYQKLAALQALYLGLQITKFRDEAHKELERFRQLLTQMESFAAGNPEWAPIVHQTKLLYDDQLSALDKVEPSTSLDEKMQLFMRISEMSEPNPEAAVARRRLRRMGAKETTSLRELEAEEDSMMKKLFDILAWGSIANFLLAAGLLSAMSQNLTKRLGVLIDNAGRIGRLEKLNDPIAGHDEIAFLDDALHVAQESLERMSKERAAIMSSIAAEMRVPLDEARQSLERVNELEKYDRTKVKGGKNPLAAAQRGIDSVLALLHGLSTLESMSIGTLELSKTECNCFEIAEGAIKSVASLAEQKQQTLVNQCQPNIIRADKGRLEQVLINYLGNAIKFAPPKTEIVVKGALLADGCRLSVTDEGPGIDSEAVEHVFEKFFQAATAEKKKGFGLGLAICRMIAQAHGGEVGVYSTTGSGSTFWIEIPA